MVNPTAQIKATEVVNRTLDNLAASPSIDMTTAEASAMKPAIIKEMSSVITNQTNQEPWYQSRVTWGAILTAAAGLAGVFGYAFPAEVQGKVIDAIIAAGPLIGAAVVLYGRYIGKKPLGE